jgi:hypothetical protein
MGLGRADLLPQSPAVTTFGPCGFGEEIVLSRRGLCHGSSSTEMGAPGASHLGTGDHVPFTKLSCIRGENKTSGGLT